MGAITSQPGDRVYLDTNLFIYFAGCRTHRSSEQADAFLASADTKETAQAGFASRSQLLGQ